MKRQGDGTDSLTDDVLARLAQDKRVRRSLPDGGRINIDRRLPFLCVYRQPAGQPDEGTEHLITTESAFLIASADPRFHKPLAGLVRSMAESLSEHFGSFLLVELWSTPPSRLPIALSHGDEPMPLVPRFKVCVHGPHIPRRSIETLTKSLRKIKVLKQAAEVECEEMACHAPGCKPLLTAAEARKLNCHVVGLEVWPIYRDAVTGDTYPAVLRSLRRGLERALKQTFFTFARNRTNIQPEHYYSLGRRTVVKLVWEVDRQLAEIGDSFDLLFQTTPVNAESAWREFKRQRFSVSPAFHYRPLAVEPALLKRRLFAIPIEKIEDPTLAYLFRQKQDELDRKITMLADIGTPRFLPESLQIYGRVSQPLLAEARELLDRIPTRSGEESVRGQLSAAAFAERARAEIDHYRRAYPDFTATVAVRDDMYAGLLVSQGRLLIGKDTKIPARRAEALLQHEVGTHLVTYFNGRAQPFRQLDLGLAGYDGLQEGLAVLSEYLVGGLSRARLRLLAARVVAAQSLVEGASFVETFRLLDRTHEFSQRTAYTITMRVYRGGGLTKDVVYLQGLIQILDYLKTGGAIEPLLIGKIAADHIPLIGELRHRQVLHAPPLRPRYLEHPEVSEKLQRLRRGTTVLQLIEDKHR